MDGTLTTEAQCEPELPSKKRVRLQIEFFSGVGSFAVLWHFGRPRGKHQSSVPTRRCCLTTELTVQIWPSSTALPDSLKPHENRECHRMPARSLLLAHASFPPNVHQEKKPSSQRRPHTPMTSSDRDTPCTVLSCQTASRSQPIKPNGPPACLGAC